MKVFPVTEYEITKKSHYDVFFHHTSSKEREL